jgi:sigma-E factor negative regulatory protein RseA
MADKTSEQVSAVIDGEYEAEEIELALRRLTKDANLNGLWQRYHLIGDAMKSNIPDVIDNGFAERVKQMVEKESLPPSRSMAPGFSWYKPAAGFAVAASVALVVTLWTLQGTNLTDPTSVGLVNVTAPPSEGLQTVESVVVDNDTALPSGLSSYIVNHSEYASMTTVYGVLPYARIVGYETEQ